MDGGGSLEVIGGGFGRTGTHTLKTALDTLGYKTHHMTEAVGKKQMPLWLQAARDKRAGRTTNWAPLLGGYNAAVDWPEVYFYKELLAANPNAKVILTMRDFEAWYTSLSDTILQAATALGSVSFPPHTAPLLALFPWMRDFRDFYAMGREVVWDGTFHGAFDGPVDKQRVREVYEAHVAEVRRVVPPERLLLFRPQDGWGPLCAFLGKEVPQQPFPHTNESASFQRYIHTVQGEARRARRIVAAYNAALVAAAVAGAALALRAARGRAGGR